MIHRMGANRGLRQTGRFASRQTMITTPEIQRTAQHRISCDGATDIPGGAALGHPKVWLEIDERGFVECGYCDKKFVLIGGPADRG